MDKLLQISSGRFRISARGLVVGLVRRAHFASLITGSPRWLFFATWHLIASAGGNPSGCHESNDHDSHKKQRDGVVAAISRVTQVSADERDDPESDSAPEPLIAVPRVEPSMRRARNRVPVFVSYVIYL